MRSALNGRLIDVLAEKHDCPLRRIVGEHRGFVAHDALEKARMKLVEVAAGNDEEIGAVAGFRQRRHHPAGRLKHSEIAILPFAQRMIDNAAALLSESHDGADAVDIRPKTAKDRQAARLDETRCCGDGLIQRNVVTIDLRIGLDEGPLEAGDRFHATVLQNLQTITGGSDFEIVAQDAAKRAGNVLIMVCAVPRLFGFQILLLMGPGSRDRRDSTKARGRR